MSLCLFQSRCRDWVVGESGNAYGFDVVFEFQSRCRDWVVGEKATFVPVTIRRLFQSRCRDWVVGELGCSYRWGEV